MKKNWPILLVIIILCGSIFILPHFLYYVIINEFSRHTRVKIVEFDGAKYKFGEVSLRNAGILLYKDIRLRCERFSLLYSLTDFFTSPYYIEIDSSNCLLHTADSEDNILGLNEILLRNIKARLLIERGKQITFDEFISGGDFGHIILSGNIRNDRYIDTIISFFLNKEFLRQLPIPFSEELDDSKAEFEIKVSIKGNIDHPDIDISSKIFNLTLKSNE